MNLSSSIQAARTPRCRFANSSVSPFIIMLIPLTARDELRDFPRQPRLVLCMDSDEILDDEVVAAILALKAGDEPGPRLRMASAALLVRAG